MRRPALQGQPCVSLHGASRPLHAADTLAANTPERSASVSSSSRAGLKPIDLFQRLVPFASSWSFQRAAAVEEGSACQAAWREAQRSEQTSSSVCRACRSLAAASQSCSTREHDERRRANASAASSGAGLRRLAARGALVMIGESGCSCFDPARGSQGSARRGKQAEMLRSTSFATALLGEVLE